MQSTAPLHIVLYEPEIPPNTGNIIRLCANTGAALHLIEPLGFDLDEKKVRRAGLDYSEMTNVKTWPNFDAFVEGVQPKRIFCCTTKGKNRPSDANFEHGDVLMFGPETRGLPEDLMRKIGLETWLRLPMKKESRSLNLSNAVAIILYEAWRQLGFPGDNE